MARAGPVSRKVLAAGELTWRDVGLVTQQRRGGGRTQGVSRPYIRGGVTALDSPARASTSRTR